MAFQLTQAYYEFEPDTKFQEQTEVGHYADRRIRIIITPHNFWFEVVDHLWPKGVVGLPQDRTRFCCTPYEYLDLHQPDVGNARMMMRWLRDENLRGNAACDAVYHALYHLEIAPSLRGEKVSFLKEYCPTWYEMMDRMFGEKLRTSNAEFHIINPA